LVAIMPATQAIAIPAPIPRKGPSKEWVLSVTRPTNGWSRSLHFQAGWVLVFTGLYYAVSGLMTRHIRTNLISASAEPGAYNPLQRITYLCVIFGLFPLMIHTGLAMSPGFVAGYPLTASVLGGQQSARTIHFVGTVLSVMFVLVHVVRVWQSGFRSRTRAMITGRSSERSTP
jgi:thiosulfate reductase cytochrome b subunit